MRRAVGVLAVIGAIAPLALPAQARPGAPAAAARARLWTAREIADACAHRPGAQMRLYGCPPGAAGPGLPEPLYVVDGRPLPSDTAGPGRAAREGRLRAVVPDSVAEITVLRADSARARFGPRAAPSSCGPRGRARGDRGDPPAATRMAPNEALQPTERDA